MPDGEKVIKGLCDAIGIIHGYVPKRYWGHGEQACRDAIDLLKEQEAEWLDVDDKHDAFDCSKCGAMVGRKCLYCPGCGAKMKNGTRAMG